LGSRIGTIASQLGHCCLKLVGVAMNHISVKGWPRPSARVKVVAKRGFYSS
jgi:hypothetical protein